ncbi:hypothetical protein EJ03DRAFT_332191 [Teratosphaeria nubilosa]|uniref:Uncharacterized protein n=1 Tax=Teratosphaeria nubilosa TaxID=161662 RepID=A0A6G1KUP6_9PEZI|nr:hypothetical protein EJ03DRAFT_332191 [Teratosphaeria nubilosa]
MAPRSRQLAGVGSIISCLCYNARPPPQTKHAQRERFVTIFPAPDDTSITAFPSLQAAPRNASRGQTRPYHLARTHQS